MASLEVGFSHDIFIEWASDTKNLVLFTERGQVYFLGPWLLTCPWCVIFMKMHLSCHTLSEVQIWITNLIDGWWFLETNVVIDFVCFNLLYLKLEFEKSQSSVIAAIELLILQMQWWLCLSSFPFHLCCILFKEIIASYLFLLKEIKLVCSCRIYHAF